MTHESSFALWRGSLSTISLMPWDEEKWKKESLPPHPIYLCSERQRRIGNYYRQLSLLLLTAYARTKENEDSVGTKLTTTFSYYTHDDTQNWITLEFGQVPTSFPGSSLYLGRTLGTRLDKFMCDYVTAIISIQQTTTWSPPMQGFKNFER